MNKRTLLYSFAALFLSSNIAIAQNAIFSTVNDEMVQSIRKANADSFRSLYVFKENALLLKTWNQSLRKEYDDITQNFKISIPLPSGQNITYTITNSQTLGEPFRKSFPEVYNFKGNSEDNKYSIRITCSDETIYAKITHKATRQEWILHPESIGSDTYILFDKTDDLRKADLNCESLEPPSGEDEINDQTNLSTYSEVGIGLTRTYRVMIATNDAFTTMVGGVRNAATAIASTIDRVSEIYERDLNVRLNVVTNDTIIFTSANPGIFAGVTTHTPGLIDSNRALFRGINPTTYDLGHVFSRRGGGVAYMPAVCNNNLKAGASSGTPTFPNEYFITTVAHEIGHQFGAGHTHSARTGSCGGGNYSISDSWEIGGGSGIMSYTSSCNPLAYTSTAYQFFNAGSIRRMQTRMATFNCSGTGTKTASPTNFHAPVISNTVNNYTIPINTPFKLQLNASDQDGDILTYVFDQNNAKAVGMLTYPTGSEGDGPLFKHMRPSLTNERRFPALGNLANGNVNSFEILPQVARTINFIGFVRDNHLETGRSVAHNFALTVNADCDSFAFTNLLTADTLIADGSNAVTLNWSTATCVYNGNVNIRFSTDGGLSYPYLLVRNTPNDGSEDIIVPAFQTTKGRFMIEATDHILFNINKADIFIKNIGECIAKGTVIDNDSALTKIPGDPALNLALNPVYGTPVYNFTSNYNTNSNPSNLAYWVPANNACGGPNNNNKSKVIFEGYADQTDTFTFQFAATGGNQILNIYAGTYDNNNVCQNLVASSAKYENGNLNILNNAKVGLRIGTKYTVVMQTYNNAVPNNATFNVSYTSASNGILFENGVPDPGINYSYAYVIVNNTNNNVKEITYTPDLSNPAEYPDGDYNIYGISSSATITSLNTDYANSAYSTLYQDAINQGNNLCAEISDNIKLVHLISPLNIKLIEFKGTMNAPNKGKIYWSAIESNDLITYTLEKSENATDYIAINTQERLSTDNLKEQQNYQYIDNNINTKTYYRLKMNYLEEKTEYSKIITLQPKEEMQKVNIFPNPIKNNSILSVQTNTKEKEKVTVLVINVLGKTMATHHIDINTANEIIKIPIENYPAGLYNIGIIQNNNTSYHKLTITQ